MKVAYCWCGASFMDKKGYLNIMYMALDTKAVLTGIIDKTNIPPPTK
jgi:hypothetical protein